MPESTSDISPVLPGELRDTVETIVPADELTVWAATFVAKASASAARPLAPLGRWDLLHLNKGKVDVGTCARGLNALTITPFEPTDASFTGVIVHTAVTLANREHDPRPSRTIAEAALHKIRNTDGDTHATYEPGDLDSVLTKVAAAIDGHRDDIGPLRTGSRFETWLRYTLAERVRLTARPDLTLGAGRRDGDRYVTNTQLFDWKSGRLDSTALDEMAFAAFVAALLGRPAAAIGVWSHTHRQGIRQPVTFSMLNRIAGRVLDAIDTAAGIAAGDDDTTPGPWCWRCPHAATCEARHAAA